MFRFKNQTFDNNIYMRWIYYIYCGLMVNIGMWLVILPFFITINYLALMPENAVFLVLSSLIFYPAIMSMFSAIDFYRQNGDISPFKFFFTYGLRQFGLKGLKYGAMVTMILIISLIDIKVTYSSPIAKISLPFFIMLMLITLALACNMMYFRVRNPKLPEKDIFRVAAYYLIKKWYVSLLNVSLFLAMVTLMAIKPQLGFLLTPAIFLGIIFLNCSKLHQMKVEG